MCIPPPSHTPDLLEGRLRPRWGRGDVRVLDTHRPAFRTRRVFGGTSQAEEREAASERSGPQHRTESPRGPRVVFFSHLCPVGARVAPPPIPIGCADRGPMRGRVCTLAIVGLRLLDGGAAFRSRCWFSGDENGEFGSPTVVKTGEAPGLPNRGDRRRWRQCSGHVRDSMFWTPSLRLSYEILSNPK
eukprot:gene10119-biopygen13820